MNKNRFGRSAEWKLFDWMDSVHWTSQEQKGFYLSTHFRENVQNLLSDYTFIQKTYKKLLCLFAKQIFRKIEEKHFTVFMVHRTHSFIILLEERI